MRPADTSSRVRELCRRLQPIIGSQADRIWQAYVIENEQGREQILEYLELLVAQHFHGQIGEETAQLIPPGREDAAGSYVLGGVTYNHQELYPFGLREGEWIHHVGIFGRTGAGALRKIKFTFFQVSSSSRRYLMHGERDGRRVLPEDSWEVG